MSLLLYVMLQDRLFLQFTLVYKTLVSSTMSRNSKIGCFSDLKRPASAALPVLRDRIDCCYRSDYSHWSKTSGKQQWCTPLFQYSPCFISTVQQLIFWGFVLFTSLSVNSMSYLEIVFRWWCLQTETTSVCKNWVRAGDLVLFVYLFIYCHSWFAWFLFGALWQCADFVLFHMVSVNVSYSSESRRITDV